MDVALGLSTTQFTDLLGELFVRLNQLFFVLLQISNLGAESVIFSREMDGMVASALSSLVLAQWKRQIGSHVDWARRVWVHSVAAQGDHAVLLHGFVKVVELEILLNFLGNILVGGRNGGLVQLKGCDTGADNEV